MMKLHPLAAAALLATCLGAAPRAHAAEAADEASLPYTIQQHDTLSQLGRTLLVSPLSWRDVARFNRLRDPDLIITGQTLRVPLRLLRSTAVPARIVSTEGEVTLAGAPAAAGTAFATGQTLSTGASGSAVVQLGDGSRIKVTPATELAVGEHRRFELKAGQVVKDGAPEEEGIFASTMRLVRGSVELLATKVLRAKPLEVQTPTAVIGVRGTDYRVHHDQAASNPTRTEVLEGQVRAEVGDAATPTGQAGKLGADVPAGFGAAMQAARAPAVTPLLPAPDLSALPKRFERPVVRLVLPGERGPLRVQVAADAAFDRLVRDERVAAGSEIRLAGLDDGRWFVRVRRIDPAGIEGYDATGSFELKARTEPPGPMRPLAGQKLAVGAVPLAWAENTQAARYALEVARDDAFTDVVQRADALQGASTELTLSQPGIYHWRMASLRADGDQGPWGDARHFELRPLPESPQGAFSGDGNALQLSWAGRPDDRFQVELARDAAFTDVLARDELAQATWQLPTPEHGRYFFRYRAVEPDGFVTPWSQVLTMEVPRGLGYLWLAAPFLLLL